MTASSLEVTSTATVARYDRSLQNPVDISYLQVLSSKKEGNTQNGTAKEGNEGGSIKDNREEGVVEEETSDVQSVVQALTELVSVQTPASVWLPNKHLTFQHSGKVRPHCKSLDQKHFPPHFCHRGPLCQGPRGVTPLRRPPCPLLLHRHSSNIP